MMYFYNPPVPITIEIKLMLFSGNDFYPNGGWKDFCGYFDCLEDANQFLIDNIDPEFAWAHVVKCDQIICRWESENEKGLWVIKE